MVTTLTSPPSQFKENYFIPTEDLIDLDVNTNQDKQSTKTHSSDLVRLYLQDIGKVPLLSKADEVCLAQKIQRYLNLLEIRHQALEDALIQEYTRLISIHDYLTAKFGHRPSLKTWSTFVNLESSELRQILSQGKSRWAQIANISTSELEAIQKTGLEAKEKMIAANLRLVVSVAKKYQNRGLELLDLIQEGSLGLEKAVDKFDPTKGYRFSTYAYWWIRQGITRAIATQSHTIRIPVHITEKLNKIKKAQRKISQQQGYTPTIEDIAGELGISAQQVREILARVPRSVSLEIKVGKDKDTELGDLIETSQSSPEEVLVQESLQEDLEKLLANLTNKEREVISLRYGLKEGKCYSLADIGRTLALSRERVRQIEAKAMQKLRQPKRRHSIRHYLD
ncbi:MAG: RNA polymerase sigma factor SigC [Gloeocapsa sp. DLM2.Bin57]|nr:MAG: RNA polymerase sigma factor SigC [Gloeocapsa sp. DLM2.Bin57]